MHKKFYAAAAIWKVDCTLQFRYLSSTASQLLNQLHFPHIPKSLKSKDFTLRDTWHWIMTWWKGCTIIPDRPAGLVMFSSLHQLYDWWPNKYFPANVLENQRRKDKNVWKVWKALTGDHSPARHWPQGLKQTDSSGGRGRWAHCDSSATPPWGSLQLT